MDKGERQMKITLIKKPILPEDVGLDCLMPVMDTDIKYIRTYGDGEVIKAEVKRDRFYPLTQKYWALCELVANNHKVDEALNFLDNKHTVDEYIKLRLNLIESRMVFPDGTVHVKTGSISHQAKDKDEFQKYFDMAVQIMSEVSGISVTDLLMNWQEYECGVE
jgi:hypothetical protein